MQGNVVTKTMVARQAYRWCDSFQLHCATDRAHNGLLGVQDHSDLKLLAFKIAFCDMKRLWLFRFPPGWDSGPSQVTPPGILPSFPVTVIIYAPEAATVDYLRTQSRGLPRSTCGLPHILTNIFYNVKHKQKCCITVLPRRSSLISAESELAYACLSPRFCRAIFFRSHPYRRFFMARRAILQGVCARGCFCFWGLLAEDYSLPVPVCQHHHDVQGCQEINKVKKGVIISHTIILIAYYLLTSFLLITWNNKINKTWALMRTVNRSCT